ncbi:hypothetical protein ACFL08_04450 [Patescibacteria group bacterium]
MNSKKVNVPMSCTVTAKNTRIEIDTLEPGHLDIIEANHPWNATCWDAKIDHPKIERVILIKNGLNGLICGILAMISPTASREELECIRMNIGASIMILNISGDILTFNNLYSDDDRRIANKLDEGLCMHVRIKKVSIDIENASLHAKIQSTSYTE